MQLPYEIWNIIVSYLPVGQARELYTANSVLFDIAMDLRYQEALFCTDSPKDSRVFTVQVCNISSHPHTSYTHASSYPHLSCQPKTLQIDLSRIAISLAQKDFKEARGCDIIPPSLPQFQTSLQNAWAHYPDSLPLRSSTFIQSRPIDSAVTKRSLANFCRSTASLLSLQVRAIFDNLKLLVPSSLHLPHLEIFTVNALQLELANLLFQP
jgi:hypothetical protein